MRLALCLLRRTYQFGIGRSLESVEAELEDAEASPESSRSVQDEKTEEVKENTADDQDNNPGVPEESNGEEARAEACSETPKQKAEEASCLQSRKCEEQEGDSEESKACEEQEEKCSQEEKEDSTESTQDTEAHTETEAEEKARAAEVQEIRSLGELTSHTDLAETFISAGRSLDDFKAEIKALSTESNVTNTTKPMEKFNLLRALRGFTSKADANFSESYEFKMIEEAKRNHNAVDADIILEPEMFRSLDGSEPLNQTIYRPDLYTGVLRPESVLAKTGATVVPVDGPSISFSVATSGMAGGFVDLNGEIPSADMAFALKQMTPKKCGAYTQIDYKALLQDRPEIEGIVMDDIVKGVDEAIDFAAITGTGQNNEPTGILNTTGVNEIAASGIYTLEGIQEFEEKIRESNDFSENLAWVMCGKDYYKFMRTYLSSTSQNEFLLDPKTRLMLGHPVAICNKLQPGEVILGNFAELFVATFDGLRLKVVEDAQLSRKQAVEVQCFTAADVLVRRPKSFSVSKNA